MSESFDADHEPTEAVEVAEPTESASETAAEPVPVEEPVVAADALSLPADALAEEPSASLSSEVNSMNSTAATPPASQPFTFDSLELDNTVNPTGSMQVGMRKQNGPNPTYTMQITFTNMGTHPFPHHWWDGDHDDQHHNFGMIAEDGLVHVVVNNGIGVQENSPLIPYLFEPGVPHRLCLSVSAKTITLEDMDKGITLISFSPQHVTIPPTGRTAVLYVGANVHMCYDNGIGEVTAS